MASDKTTVNASKKLSWLLRHGAAEAGIVLDQEGWASVAEVLRVLAMNRAQFDRAVETNEKKRFDVDGDLVRACQGHSEGVGGVTLEALEQSWEVLGDTDGIVWHGTHVDALEGIAAEGISSVSRTHVHLASTTDAKVGKRANVDILLGVSLAALRSSGQTVWRSANGVVLVRHVPAAAIVALASATKHGEKKLAWAKSLFSIL